MPTDDKARPRKTLTIKKTAPAAPSADDEAPRRKRIGARARLVAQMERAKEQQHAPRRKAPRQDAAHQDDAPRRRPRAPRKAEIFPVYAPCPQGIEEALAAEMQALGFEDARAGRAGCAFSTDWAGVQRANLYSRLATRILVQVAQADIGHEDDILDLARSVPWERWFGRTRPCASIPRPSRARSRACSTATCAPRTAFATGCAKSKARGPTSTP